MCVEESGAEIVFSFTDHLQIKRKHIQTGCRELYVLPRNPNTSKAWCYLAGIFRLESLGRWRDSFVCEKERDPNLWLTKGQICHYCSLPSIFVFWLLGHMVQLDLLVLLSLGGPIKLFLAIKLWAEVTCNFWTDNLNNWYKIQDIPDSFLHYNVYQCLGWRLLHQLDPGVRSCVIRTPKLTQWTMQCYQLICYKASMILGLCAYSTTLPTLSDSWRETLNVTEHLRQR